MPLHKILADGLRFLTFRRTSPAVVENWRAFLAFGLFFTWLAGVGRYWDNPKAHLVQHLGLGSLVYVFSLVLFLAIFSMATAPVLLIFYGWLVFRTYRPAKNPPPPWQDA